MNTFSGYNPELGKHLLKVYFSTEETRSQGIFLNISGYIPELEKTTPSQGIFLNLGNNAFLGYNPEQVTVETPA